MLLIFPSACLVPIRGTSVDAQGLVSFGGRCLVLGFVSAHAFVGILLCIQLVVPVTDNLVHFLMLFLRKFRHL